MWHGRTTIAREAFARLVLAAFLGATAAVAQDEEAPTPLAERPVVRAGTIPVDFRFDGRLEASEWRVATDSIANLVMVEPDEGEAPTMQTIVKVMADRDHILVGVQCFDPVPQSITSFSKARDSALENEDHVAIVFDTFLDSRSGYSSAVNPSGARFDGLISERRSTAIGTRSGKRRRARDDRGWSVEIRIPIKSLYFKRNATTWGFNVERSVPAPAGSRAGGRAPAWTYEITRSARPAFWPTCRLRPRSRH